MKFTSEKDISLLELVKAKMGFVSNTKARNVIKIGQIMVSGKVIKIPSTLIKPGTEVELARRVKSKRVLKEEPILKHKILFEDENILAVDKRTGLIVKSSNGNLRTLFTDVNYYLKGKGVDTCLMVNKVDKKESGIVVFAKELSIYKELSDNWKKYTKRHYIVIPGGMVDEKGNLADTFHENDIGLLLPGKGKKTMEVSLDYRVMKSNGQFTVIRIEEISSHKNQIRAMFSLLKNPILGDDKYRSEYKYEKGMAAHFFSIKFPYNDYELEIKTPIPKPFLKLAR
ncbi:MAG: pseudouridine synthase [Flavobacteriales bacterium]